MREYSCRALIIAYMVLLFVLVIVAIPIVLVMLAIAYLRDGTLELEYPPETQNG